MKMYLKKSIFWESLFFNGTYRIGVKRTDWQYLCKLRDKRCIEDLNETDEFDKDVIIVKLLFKLKNKHIVLYKKNVTGLNNRGINKLKRIFNNNLFNSYKFDEKGVSIGSINICVKSDVKVLNYHTKISDIRVLINLFNRKRNFIFSNTTQGYFFYDLNSKKLFDFYFHYPEVYFGIGDILFDEKYIKMVSKPIHKRGVKIIKNNFDIMLAWANFNHYVN